MLNEHKVMTHHTGCHGTWRYHSFSISSPPNDQGLLMSEAVYDATAQPCNDELNQQRCERK